ncbi:hypothetical protein SO802_011055 [Lithocarpus litseifolius]|uniref:ADP-ribosyl cyclase/cyclic ADP-ribose hydrolase n=1 Tax=Lithocarpus litseifolius TaxID=425828 RepID=A0AAW2DIJ5_9ROSI
MASVDTVNAFSSSSSLPFTDTFYEDRKKYDVYLSFRGSDTRNNITDRLYSTMNQKGIRTFRDDEQYEQGKSVHSELVRAIEDSKIAVIVLSQNYVFSTWCLAELAAIVECME